MLQRNTTLSVSGNLLWFPHDTVECLSHRQHFNCWNSNTAA